MTLSLRLAFVLTFISTALLAQPRWDAARIQLELEKLNTVGNAMYLAAHPDDENTKLIAWLANEQKVRTSYLALTRGDGGQNLIGDEKGALLGLIRTQELREARKIDGGEQFFSRALDFGYSKNSDETLLKWNKDSVLSDMVMTIRKFKPDVIVLRFPPNNYAGHGHHSTSAILAEQAFEMAADPNAYPTSAKKYGTWEPTRMFFNNSSWWDKDIEKNSYKYLKVDVGAYNPLLGKSYSEIAGMSRSQHRSQGFGAALAKGSQIEYLEFTKGETATTTLFEGIDLSWNRVEGGEAIGNAINAVLEKFNPNHPETSIAALVEIYTQIEAMPENQYKAYKLKQTRDIIAACGGLYIELLSDKPLVTPRQQFDATLQAVAQNSTKFSITKIAVGGQKFTLMQDLNNSNFEQKIGLTAPNEITNPYWLNEPAQNDLFVISKKEWLGLPQNPAFTSAEVTVKYNDVSITYNIPIQYKWVDRALGELHREVNVIPTITATPDVKALVFTGSETKKISVKVAAHEKDAKSFTVSPNIPQGWTITPKSVQIDELNAGEMVVKQFEITPPNRVNQAALTFQLAGSVMPEKAKDLIEIAYPHIETQVVMPDAQVQLVSAPAKVIGQNVGYIMGAGDEVPAAIEQLGLTVNFIDIKSANLGTLKANDAVVIGVRAYNVLKELPAFQSVLNQYIEEGGHVVVQYNTNRGLLTENVGPYPLHISYNRVTVEEAEATLLDPKHALLNKPNEITNVDFNNWVQERGLYFADEWDENYTPLISWNDPGEEPMKGSLLVAHYGKGSYIFTGISFFRELPAGVPGAYRLWANIISYRQPKDGK